MNLKKVFLSIAVPTLIGFFGIALSAWSSTTIGTDISTTGTLTASTTAAGADITLKADDDLIVSAVDYRFSSPSASGTFDVDLQSGSGTSDFTIENAGFTNFYGSDGSSGFSAEFAPTGIALYLNSGAEFQLSDGFMDVAATTTIDSGGGADELTVGNGISTFTGRVKLPTASAPPIACAAGTVAQVYYDTDINEPCYCNASAWTAFDGAGACS